MSFASILRASLLIVTMITASTLPGAADTYPSRPVRVIVPFAPGGPTDVTARLIVNKLAEQTGKQFYVENVGGAGGNVGEARAAQSAPDGYTLLVTGGNHVNNPSLYAHMPYDPIKDFAPVTIATDQPVVLAINPSVPAKSVKELVDLVRATPGKYSFASPGTGTPPQLVGELFKLSLKLDLVHVPFGGGGPAVGSTVAGHTPISFGAMAPAVPLIKDGKLRALAVTSKKRSQALPDVPTMAEAGFPDVEGTTWTALFVPAGTPKDIVVQLNKMALSALSQPDVKERLAALGVEPVANSPEECDAFVRAEMVKWSKVIKAAGIKAE
jgi:tripartite-type tricarboxylate transporter receptor subunit TctC